MLLLIFREWTGTQKKFPMFDLTFEIQLKLSLTIHSLQLHKTKAVCSGSLGRYVAFCTSHNVRWHFSIALVLFNLNCATCRETKPLFLLCNLFSQHTEAVERWLLAQQCRDSTFFLIYFWFISRSSFRCCSDSFLSNWALIKIIFVRGNFHESATFRSDSISTSTSLHRCSNDLVRKNSD